MHRARPKHTFAARDQRYVKEYLLCRENSSTNGLLNDRCLFVFFSTDANNKPFSEIESRIRLNPYFHGRFNHINIIVPILNI